MTRAAVPWISELPGGTGVRVSVYVQPGAKVACAAGEYMGCLKLKISAPPINGAANEAVIEWIAQKLGIRASKVCLVSGQTSRRKLIEILDIGYLEAKEKLLL